MYPQWNAVNQTLCDVVSQHLFDPSVNRIQIIFDPSVNRIQINSVIFFFGTSLILSFLFCFFRSSAKPVDPALSHFW